MEEHVFWITFLFIFFGGLGSWIFMKKTYVDIKTASKMESIYTLLLLFCKIVMIWTNVFSIAIVISLISAMITKTFHWTFKFRDLSEDGEEYVYNQLRTYYSNFFVNFRLDSNFWKKVGTDHSRIDRPRRGVAGGVQDGQPHRLQLRLLRTADRNGAVRNGRLSRPHEAGVGSREP